MRDLSTPDLLILATLLVFVLLTAVATAILLRTVPGVRKYKQAIILLLLSAVLGIGFTKFATFSNVSPCISSPGCSISNERGIYTVATRGYPLVIRQVETFEPTSHYHYTVTSTETEGLSVPHLVLNVLFWYALLDLGRRFLQYLRLQFGPKIHPAK